MEPEQKIIMGSFVFDSFPSDAPKVDASKSKNKTNCKKTERIISQSAFTCRLGKCYLGSQDIRSCFAVIQKIKKMKRKGKKEENSIILTD